MTVRLTPELEQLVLAKVRSGRYGSASDVIGAALRLLADEESPVSTRAGIRQKIEEGVLSAETGPLLDGDEVFDRLDAELALLDRAPAE